MVCPLVSKEEGKKIMQDRRTKWEAEQAAQRAGKQQKQQHTTPGQAHAQMFAKEIGSKQAHQDNYFFDVEDAVFCFLQGGQTTDALIAAQQTREKLNTDLI